MRYLKPVAATLALAVAATSMVGTAEARHRRHHHDRGDAVAAGIFGFAAGAILGGALSQPRYYQPPVYYSPRPVYVQPAPVYYAADPWSPQWYQYCSSRYRSFNPQTGYYLGYDGAYHFCQ